MADAIVTTHALKLKDLADGNARKIAETLRALAAEFELGAAIGSMTVGPSGDQKHFYIQARTV